MTQEWKDVTLVPLHKKKDQKGAKTRGIATQHCRKVLALVQLEGMQVVEKLQLSEAQCMWFQERPVHCRPDMGNMPCISCASEYRTPVHLCFIDLTKAYDSVDRAAMAAILRSNRVHQHLVKITEDLYAGTWCHVRTLDRTSQDFEVKTLGKVVSNQTSYIHLLH